MLDLNMRSLSFRLDLRFRPLYAILTSIYSKVKNDIQVHVKIDKLESHIIELEKLGGQNSACLELVCNAVIDNSHFDTRSCNVRYFFFKSPECFDAKQ